MCGYLPWAQCDQTNVVTERTLLNLVDELGQLGVCAAAVVNLTTCSSHNDYDHTHVTIRLIRTMWNASFTLVTCSSTSSSSASSSSTQNLSTENQQLSSATCHCHLHESSWWLCLPAPGLWLIVTLVLCDDELLITLISSLFCVVFSALLQQLECFIILQGLNTHEHTQTRKHQFNFKDFWVLYYGCACAGLLTFLFIAYFNWTLPLIISNRSSRFCLFSSSSWWRIIK